MRPGTMGALVVTSDAEAIRTVLTGDPLSRRSVGDVVRPLVGDGSIFLLAPREHLARRKLLLPPFHGSRVRAYGDLAERLMEAEVARWRRGDAVAVLPAAQDVTIEVILQAVLGVCDAETRRHLRRVIDGVLFYPMGAARIQMGSRLPRLRGLPVRVREAVALLAALPTPAVVTYFPELKTRTWCNPTTVLWWRHRDRFVALLDEHVAATRADPQLDERDDVLALLLRARDEDGRGLTDDELHSDLIALIGAGHETTAAAIAWGAVLLAHHPGVADRARRAAREDDDAWLAALVKEVLRLRPPLPVAAVRELDEPVDVDGHRVPAGTPIGIDAWGLHHDPARHRDPERFAPERFLGDDAEPYTWLPFGGGAHRCIGAALAELEIKVALRAILRRGALAAAERELPPIARRGLVMVPHGGGRVLVA